MTFRTVSEVLDAEFVEATRLSSPPSITVEHQPLAGHRSLRVGGTNYLPWLEISLFLQQQMWGRK